jgi:hypothetical protein
MATRTAATSIIQDIAFPDGGALDLLAMPSYLAAIAKV